MIIYGQEHKIIEREVEEEEEKEKEEEERLVECLLCSHFLYIQVKFSFKFGLCHTPSHRVIQ